MHISQEHIYIQQDTVLAENDLTQAPNGALLQDSVAVPASRPQPATVHPQHTRYKADTFYVSYKKQFDIQQKPGSKPLNSRAGDKEKSGLFVTRGLAEHTEIEHGPKILQSRPKAEVTDNWIFFVLLACVVMLGIMRFSYNKVLQQTFRSVVNYRDSYKLYLENSNTYTFANMALNLTFFLSFGLYLFFLVVKTLPAFTRLPGILVYGDLLLLLFAFIVIKLVLYKIAGYLFNIKDVVDEYLHLGAVYNKIGGILFLPLVVFIRYLPFESLDFLFYFGFGLFVILYGWQLYRGFQIILQKNLSVYYSILYLCTIEILPLLLISKIVVQVN